MTSPAVYYFRTDPLALVSCSAAVAVRHQRSLHLLLLLNCHGDGVRSDASSSHLQARTWELMCSRGIRQPAVRSVVRRERRKQFKASFNVPNRHQIKDDGISDGPESQHRYAASGIRMNSGILVSSTLPGSLIVQKPSAPAYHLLLETCDSSSSFRAVDKKVGI